MKQTVLIIIFLHLLISGCATQTSRIDSKYAGIEKIIMIESASKIKEICSSEIIKSKHIECIFIPADSKFMPFPEWVTQLQLLKKDSRNMTNDMVMYGQTEPRLSNYENIALYHVFTPGNKRIIPFFDSITKNYKYMFFAIHAENIDGIKTNIIKPVTIQDSDFTKTNDYAYEAWEIIGNVFPVASGSAEVNKYISDQKTAIKNAEKLQIVEEKIREKQENIRKEQQAKQTLADYRSKFNNAKTKNAYLEFINEYKSNDPDNLIGKAKTKASQIEKENTLADAEKQLIFCKIMVNNAQNAIDRENRKAYISGYINKQIMYEAATYIESCTSHYPELIEKYRKAGGIKDIWY